MFRPPRQIQVPRYNSKRPQTSKTRDSKYSRAQSAHDPPRPHCADYHADKPTKKRLQKQIKFDKQNFQCEMHRSAFESNSEEGYNNSQSVQSGSIISGNFSFPNILSNPEQSSSSHRPAEASTAKELTLEQKGDLDPIVKHLLGFCGGQAAPSFPASITKQRQSTQIQPANPTYCPVKSEITPHAAQAPSQEIQKSLSQLQSPEMLKSLRSNMTQNLIMLFVRIMKLLQSLPQVPVQELTILANLIPAQVQKIHLVDIYLQREEQQNLK